MASEDGEMLEWPLAAESAFRSQTAELAMLGPGVQLSLVLMASHPEIAEAVTHHSQAMNSEHVLGRLHRLSGTLGHAIRIVHGTPEEAIQSRTQIYHEHLGINSQLSGSDIFYDANSADAQAWVLMSLYKAGSWVIPRYTGGWEPRTQDAFYEGHVRFASFFNPAITMPSGRVEADTQNHDVTRSERFGSTPASQEVLKMVLGSHSGSGRTTRLSGEVVRLIMAEHDPVLTDRLGLSLDEKEQKRAERLDRWAQRVYSRTPSSLRRSAPPLHLTYSTLRQAATRIGSIWSQAFSTPTET